MAKARLRCKGYFGYITDIAVMGKHEHGSPMITLRRVAVCTMVSLWLAGCTNNASTSAPISSVGGGGAVPSGNNNGGAQQVSPEGRIVYNRSYNAIPKGATAAVKPIRSSAATRCFISLGSPATISATAQRNNIPEPYSLNVGQTIQLGNGSANGGGGMLATTDATKGGVPKPPSSSQIQTATVDSQSTNAYSENSGKQNVGKMLPTAGAAAVGTATAPVTAPEAAPPVSSTVSNSSPVSTGDGRLTVRLLITFPHQKVGIRASISPVPVGSLSSLPPMAA